MAMTLPRRLRTPHVVGGEVVAQTVLDLTVYLEGPSVDEFDVLVQLYESMVSRAELQQYAIAELPDWDLVGDPDLTKQGRAAAAKGAPRPFLAPVRTRIQDGRDFEFRYWDGKEVGSSSFACQRITHEDDGGEAQSCFARILLPLDTDPEALHRAACEIAEHVDILSGHGGLSCGYHPGFKYDGFTVNYGRARRWWGLDIEDLNLTLPMMGFEIKGAQWITLVGHRFGAEPSFEGNVGGLSAAVGVARHAHATVLRAGPHPVVGDQHRQKPGLEAYEEVARLVEPLTVRDHEEFGGDGFVSNQNTNGWFHRFTDPSGWR